MILCKKNYKVQIKAAQQQQCVILGNFGVALHTHALSSLRIAIFYYFANHHTHSLFSVFLLPKVDCLTKNNDFPDFYCGGEFYHKVLLENFNLITVRNVIFQNACCFILHV